MSALALATLPFTFLFPTIVHWWVEMTVLTKRKGVGNMALSEYESLGVHFKVLAIPVLLNAVSALAFFFSENDVFISDILLHSHFFAISSTIVAGLSINELLRQNVLYDRMMYLLRYFNQLLDDEGYYDHYSDTVTDAVSDEYVPQDWEHTRDKSLSDDNTDVKSILRQLHKELLDVVSGN